MKKTIFISVLALAAAISCTKSDIVDTKFENEAIGFETYLGRDAQTKASETTTTSLAEFGVYGFYTATIQYDPTNTKHAAANLMDNVKVTKSGNVWSYSPARYWNHEEDLYTFFAYSPYSVGKVGGAPVIEYTVKDDPASQEDVVYSVNARNVSKKTCTFTDGTYVPFTFKHALARLSVKANAVMYDKQGAIATDQTTVYDNRFTITNISIKGKFCKTGSMNLSAETPVWTSTPSTTDITYDLTGTVEQLLDGSLYDFSANTAKGYLMMMPTQFSEANPAVLSVTYYVTYAGEKSKPITKTVNVPTNFQQGKAYTINLTLQRDSNNAITFTVKEVSGWETGSTQTPTING